MSFRNFIFKILSVIPDKPYLRIRYFQRMHKILHLKNPKTYNEKLQWLKLYDRKPLYTKLVDKYLVREYVKEKIGEDYLIPLLAVYERAEDIDFDALPDEFVLKCTHDSGGLVICRDKADLDKTAAKTKIGSSLKVNYYLENREWPYKDVPRKIIAEKFIGDVEGRNVVIVDDMVDTAGTITKCADMLKEKGAVSVRAVCTHPVLSGNAYERISASALSEFIVSDTIPLRPKEGEDTSKFKILSVANIFADIITKVYNNRPISDTYIF